MSDPPTTPDGPRRDFDPDSSINEVENLLGEMDGGEQSGLNQLREQAGQWNFERVFDSLRRATASLVGADAFDVLIRRVLDAAIEQSGAERGILFLGGERDQEFVPLIARSIGGDEIRDLAGFSRTILHLALAEEGILIDDASAMRELSDAPSVQLGRLRSVVCVPLRFRGELIGALYVDDPNRSAAFPRAVRSFLELFGILAATMIESARRANELEREHRAIERAIERAEGPTSAFSTLRTCAPSMQRVLELAAAAARTQESILILGETGTGKELLAHAIHRSSSRADAPFVAQNCAAVPRDLAESLFFGHAKGAFSGAIRETPGLFRAAEAGTIFLDEIGELRTALQSKLLRTLEDHRVRPVGAVQDFAVDVRVIAATSTDLDRAVETGSFRRDLYYRLNVLEIRVPPLRERPEDVEPLLLHFLEKHAAAGVASPNPTPDALDRLRAWAWPGNVRELENLARRLLVYRPGEEVGAEIIDTLLHPVGWHVSVKQIPRRRDEPASQATPANDTVSDRPALPASPPRGFLTLEEREREAILQAIQLSANNRAQAARLLGLSRNALLRRMSRLGLDAPTARPDEE